MLTIIFAFVVSRTRAVFHTNCGLVESLLPRPSLNRDQRLVCGGLCVQCGRGLRTQPRKPQLAEWVVVALSFFSLQAPN